jgi:hypothetical protein
MSQVSPGWYPDPSGRFVQRYHDGNRWTEHVADAHGNRATDVPAGQAGPASHGGAARGYGEGAQRTSQQYGQPSAGSDRGYGGHSSRQQGYGQEAPASDRSYGRRPAREDGGAQRPMPNQGHDRPPGGPSWDRGPGAGRRQAHGGGPQSRHEWPQAEGGGQQADDGWSGAAAGRAGDADWRGAGPGSRAARFDARWPDAQRTTYRQPDQAYAPSGSSAGFTPTIGLIVAGVGAVLLLLSLFGLDFLELSFPGLSRSISLGDISGDFGDGAPTALATYADLGRFLAVLVAVLAILAVANVISQLRAIPALPVIVAGACGAFALWHVLAMLADGEEGVNVSPTFGAILGVLGYVLLAAGPFLRQPVQASAGRA